MRHFTRTLFLILTLLSSQGHSAPTELKIAIYDFPPHVFMDEKNTEPTGAAIEFVKKTLDLDTQYKIRWVASPFSRFLKDLESNKADMGFFLAKTSEREKIIRFAEHSVFTTPSGIILPKDFPFTDLKDLKGRVLGHTQGSVIPEYFAKSKIKFDALSGEDVIERNLQRLKLKRIDGIFIPTFSNGEYNLNKLHLTDSFKVVQIPNSSLELYIVFSKSLDEKTVSSINTLINKKYPLYNTILEKYLKRTL